MSVFVGLEGYTLPSGYMIKELCIIFPNGEYNHFLFQKPDWLLSEVSRRTIRYATQHLNNLSFEDGDIPYIILPSLLEKIKEFRVYTYSDIAQKFLQQHLPTTSIENIQTTGYQIPKELPDSKCFRDHNQRYCAKAKALEIKKFYEKNEC